MNRWYVVQSKPKNEFTARHQLRNQDFEVFLPLYRSRMMTKRFGPQIIVAPIFPSYLFVAFDRAVTRWRAINGTRGVKCIVGMDNELPSPLPVGFIEAMQAVAHNGIMNMAEALEKVMQFNAGDRLKIVSGPLAGRVGMCQSMIKDTVSIQIDGHALSFLIKAKIDQVELAAE